MVALPTPRVEIAFSDSPTAANVAKGVLSGLANSYFTTPDAAALDITGDIDISARVALTDWTPAANSTIVSKWLITVQAYWLYVTTTGALVLATTTDGTTTVSQTSSVPSFVDGTTYWVRATLDVNDGSGNKVYTFYTAPDSEIEPTSWTVLSTHTVAGTTSIYSSSQQVEIGSQGLGNSRLTGDVHRVIIRNSIAGTVVADFWPADATSSSSTTWGSSRVAGQTWTKQSAASLTITPTWTDVSSYLRSVNGIDVNRGKEDELQTFAQSTCTFTLSNRDRRFDPDYASSPYNLTGRKQVRVRGTYLGTNYPLWQGVLESFPQTYATGNTDGTVTLTAYDMLTFLAEQTLEDAAYTYAKNTISNLGSAYRIRSDRQWADAITGKTISRRAGVVTLGEQMGVGIGSPVVFNGTGGFSWSAFGASDGIQTNTSGGWSFWVNTTTTGASSSQLRIIIQSLDQFLTTKNTTRIGINSSGKVVVDHPGFFTLNTVSTTAVNDGVPHHVFIYLVSEGGAVFYRIYIDGQDSTGTYSNAPDPGYDNSNFGAITYVGATDGSVVGDQNFVGTLQDVYGFRSSAAVTAAKAQTFQRLSAGSLTESTGDRFSRLLSLAGLPASSGAAATTTYGQVSVIDTYEQPVLGLLQTNADSEQGRLYCSNTGRIIQQDRFWWAGGGSVNRATFNDDGTNVRMAAITADRPLREVQNTITVTGADGVTGRASDSTSITNNGTRSQTISTNLSSQGQVDSMATGLLALRKDALTRLGQITVNPGRDVSWTTVLALEIGDRITVNYVPVRRAATTTAISKTLIVERLDWSIRQDNWQLNILGSPVPSYSPFVLDSSTLDGTDLIGF